MTQYTTLVPLFSDIANAIRSKNPNAPSSISAASFPDQISAIPTGTGVSGTINITSDSSQYDVSTYQYANVQAVEYLAQELGQYDAAANSDVKSGKYYIDDHGAIQSGTLSINSGGTKYPSTTTQTIVAPAYLSSNLKIAPVSQTNLVAGNIRNGVTVRVYSGSNNIYNITGTYKPSETYTLSVNDTKNTSVDMGVNTLYRYIMNKGSDYDIQQKVVGSNTSTFYDPWGATDTANYAETDLIADNFRITYVGFNTIYSTTARGRSGYIDFRNGQISWEIGESGAFVKGGTLISSATGWLVTPTAYDSSSGYYIGKIRIPDKITMTYNIVICGYYA